MRMNVAGGLHVLIQALCCLVLGLCSSWGCGRFRFWASYLNLSVPFLCKKETFLKHNNTRDSSAMKDEEQPKIHRRITWQKKNMSYSGHFRFFHPTTSNLWMSSTQLRLQRHLPLWEHKKQKWQQVLVYPRRVHVSAWYVSSVAL